MSKKDKKFKKPLTLNNSFQQSGTENPEVDLESKRAREEIVKRFLEERDNNANR